MVHRCPDGRQRVNVVMFLAYFWLRNQTTKCLNYIKIRRRTWTSRLHLLNPTHFVLPGTLPMYTVLRFYRIALQLLHYTRFLLSLSFLLPLLQSALLVTRKQALDASLAHTHIIIHILKKKLCL